MAGTAGMGTAGTVAAPPNSFGSVVTNGQLVGTQTQSAYYPKNFGGGISSAPAGMPVSIPPSVGYGLLPGSASQTPVPSGSTPGMVGGALSNSTTQRGGYNGKLAGSPAMWALVLMAFGVLWMRYVHWRKPKARKSED